MDPFETQHFSLAAFHKRLPTKSNLLRRGVNISSATCSLCNDGIESENHLFFNADSQNTCCSTFADGGGRTAVLFSNFDQLIDWCYQLDLPRHAKKGFKGVFYAYIWSLWSLRNSTIFSNSRPVRES
ncbi:hypothetical protein OSB04_010170 [Centaurea solstitialis]|uniref:Reverse transcriptase zinc-binding domain-containing protein n=1 Tax=Centaurea solstitialis TaxID=347529 RepID=A0AA38TK83_9ASTR|nr:hypothetical protein OSB04_010170 [Centaurea solstitialis]